MLSDDDFMFPTDIVAFVIMSYMKIYTIEHNIVHNRQPYGTA